MLVCRMLLHSLSNSWLHVPSVDEEYSRPANNSTTSLAEIRLGARLYYNGTKTGFVDADIAELLLYDTCLSPDRVRALSSHLQTKYCVASLIVSSEPVTLDDAVAALLESRWESSRQKLEPTDEIERSGDSDVIADLECRLATMLESGPSPRRY